MGQSVVEYDPLEALQLLNSAAEKGSAHARFELARLYLDGTGVAENQQQAMEYMKDSAERKFFPAITFLLLANAKN